MTNEMGLCLGCVHEEDCNMHKRHPERRVVDCTRYEMNDTYREISNAIHETAKMFRMEKDGEHTNG